MKNITISNLQGWKQYDSFKKLNFQALDWQLYNFLSEELVC